MAASLRIPHCLVLLAAGLAACQSTGNGGAAGGGNAPGAAPPANESSMEVAADAEPTRNAANLFLGGSWSTDDEEGFTVGLDYEYRASEPVGVGAFVDFVSGDMRTVAFGAGAFVHPFEALTLVVLPGVEYHRDDGDWNGLLRLGGFYEFELGKGFILAPAAYYDIAQEDDVFVLGLNFGYKF